MRTPDITTREKVLNEEATPEETREVVRWFRTSEGQAWLSERMDQDERTIHPGEEEAWIGGEIPSVVMYERIMRQVRRRRIARWVAIAAAVLLPVAIALGLFLHVDARVDLLADSGYDEVVVPDGERMQVLFQDGSKAHLNGGTRLRYPRKFALDERKVYLEGEAWFDVAKNSGRPFVVDLSCLDITVLGTAFDVKAYPNERDIQIVLERGSIELKSPRLAAYRMHPGQKAVYDRESGHCEVTPSRDAGTYSAWRRNVLVFDNAPLPEVMQTLSRAYAARFTVKDSAALAYSYTITTDTTSLSAILRELEKITPVSFKERPEGIEVSLRR